MKFVLIISLIDGFGYSAMACPENASEVFIPHHQHSNAKEGQIYSQPKEITSKCLLHKNRMVLARQCAMARAGVIVQKR